MSRFHTEPALAYTAQNRTAVLLLNLGTPDAPTAAAVKPYLKEFLSDQRVVELPKLLWQPILRGLVLTFRPKKSAHAYEKVWFKEGSPLEVYTHRQAEALAKHLPDVIVRHAMTYGNPSVADVWRNSKPKAWANCWSSRFILNMPALPPARLWTKCFKNYCCNATK